MKRLALYHLETLTWIARLGTFRAAAERLNTTQPAISARVREVEEQLGIPLFQREGRRMVLTARGRLLIQACEPLWTGLEQALLEIGDYAGASGMVRVGSGEIAAASCLPAFIHGVERDMPGVTLEVERHTRHCLSGRTGGQSGDQDRADRIGRPDLGRGAAGGGGGRLCNAPADLDFTRPFADPRRSGRVAPSRGNPLSIDQ
jgi:DNA-binding transcriptional LysR family regulator